MKICDMCKKEIPDTPFLPARFPLVTVVITESVNKGMRMADLCADCQLRVYNFITLKKPRKAEEGGAE